MNIHNYKSAEQEEQVKEYYSCEDGPKLCEWLVGIYASASRLDAPEQVIVETEMIWTQVNQ